MFYAWNKLNKFLKIELKVTATSIVNNFYVPNTNNHN